MSHEIESCFSVREVPWHGLGIILQDAPTSRDAIVAAGLDWDVVKKPVMYENEQTEYFWTVRQQDNTRLGIVQDRYKPVQNRDAFTFTDALLEGDEEVRYETAGSLRNGKTIWLLAKLPSKNILGDEIANYVCFTNSHDGTSAVKAFCTSTRVVCNNTLSIALNGAKRVWSVRHAGDVNSKIREAQETLNLANRYIDKLAQDADLLSQKNISAADMRDIIETIFPMPEDASNRKATNVENDRQYFISCYNASDISQFKGTGWGVVNAASDFVTHYQPTRMTTTYKEQRFNKILNGGTIMDDVYKMVMAA